MGRTSFCGCLDRHKGIVALDRLGLHEDALDGLRLMMARPEGIILVTGPTGSGKSTTLYSMLNHLDSESVNIMTLEDPVEYPMGRVRQTSVNEAARLTFAGGVRSLLRQGPRRHPDRGDPRRRDGGDGVPGRDDRSSGLLDPCTPTPRPAPSRA